MALEGEIIVENFDYLLDYKDCLRNIERKIGETLIQIYNTRHHVPEDLEEMQKLLDQAEEIHRDAMLMFRRRRTKKRKKKKQDR